MSQYSAQAYKRVADGVKEKLEKHLPAEMAKLKSASREKQEYFEKYVATVSEKAVKMNENLKNYKPDEKQDVDVPLELLKYYTRSHLQSIQKALNVFTYDLEKVDVGDKTYYRFHRYGKEFRLTADSDEAQIIKVASIVIEVVILALAAIGIRLPEEGNAVEEAAKIFIEKLKENADLFDVLLGLAESMKDEGRMEQAGTIFEILKKLYDESILWDVIKTLCAYMAWYDWLLASAQIAAELIGAVLTDGAELIALIAFALIGATRLAIKLVNL